MTRRVTLSDVARAAGVHHATVSRALRNHPAISPDTRTRIAAIARELGYRPDPMLSALAARKSGSRLTKFRATLAWLTNFPTRDGWQELIHSPAYHAGARERAEELGYALDEIWTGDSGGATVSRVLQARGIQGVLLPPQFRARTHLHLEWEKFAAVCFGLTLSRPSLHAVTLDHYRSTAKLVRHLAVLGFKNPRLYYSPAIHERVQASWAAGFRLGMEQANLSPEGAYRPLVLRQGSQLLEMLETDRPDVVITDLLLWNLMRPVLERAAIRVPADLSVAVLTVPDDQPELGGITENSRCLGAAAVDQVAAMVHRGDLGLPQQPFRLFFEGNYQSGTTIRAKRGQETPPGMPLETEPARL